MYVRLNPASTDILKNANVLKKFNFKIILNYSIIILTYLYISLFLIRGCSSTF